MLSYYVADLRDEDGQAETYCAGKSSENEAGASGIEVVSSLGALRKAPMNIAEYQQLQRLMVIALGEVLNYHSAVILEYLKNQQLLDSLKLELALFQVLVVLNVYLD